MDAQGMLSTVWSTDGKRTIVVNATEEESVLVEDGNGVRRVPARPSSWVEL